MERRRHFLDFYAQNAGYSLVYRVADTFDMVCLAEPRDAATG
jgi:hypothetical protein